MDVQSIVDVVMGLIMFLLGIIVNATRESIRDLKKQDSDLAEKVQRIEVLVAGNYVKRDEHERMITALFKKLDQIEEKIDRKVDK